MADKLARRAYQSALERGADVGLVPQVQVALAEDWQPLAMRHHAPLPGVMAVEPAATSGLAPALTDASPEVRWGAQHGA